jgi:predicted porin
MGALNVNADMGMFDFDVTGAYLKAKFDDTFYPKLDYSAYAFDLGLNVKPDKAMKVGVFGTYASGTDKGDALGFTQTMDALFPNFTPAGRLFLLQHGGMQDLGPGVYISDTDDVFYDSNGIGQMAFGLNFEYTLDKLTCFAQYGYVQSVEKNAARKKGVGQEIDVKVSYEIAPKTDLFLEYGYVMKGDDGFLQKDIQQILWGLSTSI